MYTTRSSSDDDDQLPPELEEKYKQSRLAQLDKLKSKRVYEQYFDAFEKWLATLEPPVPAERVNFKHVYMYFDMLTHEKDSYAPGTLFSINSAISKILEVLKCPIYRYISQNSSNTTSSSRRQTEARYWISSQRMRSGMCV